MRDLSSEHVRIRGKNIATLEELRELAYEIPEHENSPDLVSSLIGGAEPDPAALLHSLKAFEASTTSDSERLKELLQRLQHRLKTEFPDIA